MKSRLAIITEIIAPYRVPVFNALARNTSLETHIIFLSKTDPSLREWNTHLEEIQFSYEVLPNWRRRIAKYNVLLNWKLEECLEKIAPDLLICGGYNYLASWQAARWCQRHNVPLALWTESTRNDHRRGYTPVEFLKKKFLRRCQAFVAAGKSASDYLVSLQVSEQAIATAPDAVDNDFFRSHSSAVRRNASDYRERLRLPERFFLYSGRLVQSKGVFDLLEAYASLSADLRSEVGLVFVGNGRLQSELQKRSQAIRPGRVQFPGFVEQKDLPAYYALADMLVFPTHSDPWGLVVNEAMACGLPIICTNAAGCAADLVENGQNGFVVEPGALDQLAAMMDLLARNHELRSRFGAHSLKTIDANSPERCAQGLADVVHLVGQRPVYA